MDLSSHARKRLQQRGMSSPDVEAIVAYGTAVPGGYLLRARDVNEAISDLKGQISMLERLKDRVVIADRQTVITAYPASKRKQKRLLNTSH